MPAVLFPDDLKLRKLIRKPAQYAEGLIFRAIIYDAEPRPAAYGLGDPDPFSYGIFNICRLIVGIII